MTQRLRAVATYAAYERSTMKLLFAATPADGHINPMLAVVRMARKRGHDVLFVTARHFASRVEAAGARFIPLEQDADLDLRELEKRFPERAALLPGPVQLRFDMERIFLDPMASQASSLRWIVASEAPDAIVVDSFFCGATPLFLDPSRRRPPIVALGVTFLSLDRPDGAPVGPGFPPANDESDLARYAAIATEVAATFAEPVRSYANDKLAALGLPGLPCSFMQSRVIMADAYLQPTVPAFEYDFAQLPPHVHFIGALPPPPSNKIDRPHWWDELDGPRRVVLVSQGTAANFDLSQLVEPTLTALAECDDLLVIVTTGGRPITDIQVTVPSNARIESFLDYEFLMPKVDLLVTNGGYGTVSLALQAGVPIVAAGQTEDKAEVGARVAWSGVGVNLASTTPSVHALQESIARVLSEPDFTDRAAIIASSFIAKNTDHEIFDVLDCLVRRWLPVP